MPDVFTEVESMIRTLREYRDEIVAALKIGGDTHTFEDVALSCMTGKMDLHTFERSIMICELVKYPRLTAYTVFIACGSLEELLEAQGDYLAREARLRGASALSMAGRRGWERPLSEKGWCSSLILMHKELDVGQE